MTRVLLTIFLSLAVLGKSFFFLGWEIWYQLDKQEIAEQKCENKDKPMLHCNGKCYLAKQLKKAEAEESKKSSSKSNPHTYKAEIETLIFWQNTFNYAFSVVTDRIETIQYAFYPEPVSAEFTERIFHPPVC